jgi:integrase/recombinase XerC
MTISEAMERYLRALQDRGYSVSELERQRTLLRRHVLQGVAMLHPDGPRRLLETARIGTSPSEGDSVIRTFQDRVRAATESARYLNLAALLHPEFLQSARREVRAFLAALGGQFRIQEIAEGLARQMLSLARQASNERPRHALQAFLQYCFEQGWLGWNPHLGQRFPAERVFEPDFMGPAGARWADRARAYLEHLRDTRNLALGGIDYYARKLKPFVQWLDAKGVREIQLTTLKAFVEHKRSAGVSDTTLSKYLYCIRPFLDFLIRSGVLRAADNPAHALRIKSLPSARRQTLTETELKKLIDSLEVTVHRTAHPEEARIAVLHFRAVRDLALVLLFALCGLRLSEAARIRLEDVDAQKRAVRIQGKGNRSSRSKIRTVLVHELAWKKLVAYQRLRAQPGQRYLWISWTGAPLRPAGINKAIHARILQAGLGSAVSPHGLRATCASLYVKKGMDPYSLKTLLGHESLKTTMDYYARLTAVELREVWKRSNPLAGYDDE